MKSRHIIVHLIRGNAKEAHEAITRDLVERFDAFPIHNRIVPHLTLKRWFEMDETEIEQVYTALEEFITLRTQSEYTLHGFNHFGEGVIYVDVTPSPAMSETTRDLMTVLHKLDTMTFDEYDSVEDDFHATVAMRALKPFDFTETWEFLQTIPTPHFKLMFDNIAVLKREADKWVPARIWELPKQSKSNE